MGSDVMDLLRDHDRLKKTFTYEIDGLQSLDTGNKPRVIVTSKRDITSWDALYYRLRSNFDGSTYHSSTRVLDVGRPNASDAYLTVTSLNLHTNTVSERNADLVVGADGADSMIRAKYQPAVQRRYAGYVVWRGTVQEERLSNTTLKAVAHSATNHTMDQHHIIVYVIPGKDGSLQAGERLVNFCWYTNETSESLDEILRDRIDGHRHRNTVPAGRVRESAWEARLKHARAIPLPPALLEIAEKIQEPFIQVISDFFSPKGAFENGQVLLMGDALTLVRPHAGLSSAKSAFHSRAIEDFVRGRISIEEWETRVISVWLNHVLPGNPHAKLFHGSKSDLLAGRQATVPVGHILGGGTSINSLFYSRPQRSDYESWNTPGWSPEDVLPYMKKLETYNGPGPKDMHGYDGPIQVSKGAFRSQRLEDDFIAAMKTVGWPEVDDINCFGSNNGSMRLLKYMSPEGQRQDTATVYLHPRLEDGQHPNLHVLVESQVERVLFEGTRAVGVSFRPNPDYHPGPSSDSTREIKARRLVTITGGSMFSPLILQRSGIGDPKVLNKAGVPIVADVPGVGADYEDHNSMMYPYNSSLRPDETLDSLYSGRTSLDDMIAANHEMLSYGGVDVQSKLRPTEADVEALGPKFKAAWDKNFKDKLDKPLTIISPVACFPGDSSFLGPGQFLTLVTFTLYPFSRGHLYITGPKIDDPLDFDPGLLSDPDELDVKPHIWMFKKQPSSKANLDNPKPEYSADDDEIIEKWIRERINSTWHPIGTCKMAPRDKHGVVDPVLNVYGVQGLKVADLSISPHNVGANTCNTAMTVAEKAADIIISELGLVKK
ncbi:hypothetical protein ONZ43_g561 [Nemania bipapillata]|uniref:Uncharacterized protein n=1 Tax=Nemania bipapillata TaxID=110536 RepID=A0ACC2J7P7_9PEZI|nr:hypothetical protein ONZ43_g561 [Nemania bipapillata]